MFLSKVLDRDPRLCFRSFFMVRSFTTSVRLFEKRTQRVVISDMESSWRPVASRVPLTSMLGLVLLNIFVSDLDDGVECSLSQFSDNTKLGGVTDVPESHNAMQGEHSKLEKWSDRKLMKFNKRKCKFLLLGRSNPMHQYMLEGSC